MVLTPETADRINVLKVLKDESKKVISDLRRESAELFDRKISISSILEFINDCVRELVEYTEHVTNGIHEIGKWKAEFVIETIQNLYKEIDPNIPLIFDPFERWLEEFILDKVVPSSINAIVKAYNTKGVFATKED
jgi:hypothetical protein